MKPVCSLHSAHTLHQARATIMTSILLTSVPWSEREPENWRKAKWQGPLDRNWDQDSSCQRKDEDVVSSEAGSLHYASVVRDRGKQSRQRTLWYICCSPAVSWMAGIFNYVPVSSPFLYRHTFTRGWRWTGSSICLGCHGSYYVSAFNYAFDTSSEMKLSWLINSLFLSRVQPSGELRQYGK